jgi:hypothetical protein
VLRIAVGEAAGPFSASVRLRSDVDGAAEDSLSVARRTSGFGDPLIYRGQSPATMRPAGSVQFRRTERMQVRWPLVSEVVSTTVRLLGRDGIPLDLPVSLTTGGAVSGAGVAGATFAIADLNLAPLTAGEYLLEVSAVGTTDATALLAFRVTR